METYTKTAASAPVKAETPAVIQQPKGEIGISVDLSTCILCGLCVRRCPTSAIAVDRKAGTWSINRQSCVVCGNCLDVCHKHSLQKTTEGIDTTGVQVYQKQVAAPTPAPVPTPVVVEKPAPVVEETVEAPVADAPVGNGIAIDMTTCVLCGICGKKCPTSAITVDRAAKTWSIDREGCVNCGSCITACPKKSLSEGEIPLLSTYQKPAAAPAPAPTPAPVVVEKPAPVVEETVEAPVADAPVGNGIAIDMTTCVLCGICGKKCPTSAITVDRAAKTWSIDREGCVNCGSCITACPKKSLSEGEIPLLSSYTK